MSPIPSVTLWVAVPAALLLVAGGLLALVGSLGLLRLPSFYQRLHGPGLINTLGAACVLAASALVFTAAAGRPVVHEVLALAFVFLSAPVATMILARAALYRNRQLPQAGGQGDGGDA